MIKLGIIPLDILPLAGSGNRESGGGGGGKREQKYETMGRYGEEEQRCGMVEGIREMEGEMGK